MNFSNSYCSVFRRNADAAACIFGSDKYPNLRGEVWFYQLCGCVMVAAEFTGLPQSGTDCAGHFFAFHIHEGNSCSGNENDYFASALGHYNPSKCKHPYHAGDMPPLLGVDDKAFLAFITDRFNVNEIIGRTVIVHGMGDDFHSQPSGNAGEKIGCGLICQRY